MVLDPRMSDPAIVDARPERHGDEPRMVTGRFLIVTAATFCYFMSLGALLPTMPTYVEDELGGNGAHRLAEELLCKAAAELTLARMYRPGEARPCWYLHGVWARLGQRQPAGRYYWAAEQLAGLSYLTPAEVRELHLVGRLRELETSKR